jgi:hypothetical protein
LKLINVRYGKNWNKFTGMKKYSMYAGGERNVKGLVSEERCIQEAGGDTFLQNVGSHTDCMGLYPRRW